MTVGGAYLSATPPDQVNPWNLLFYEGLSNTEIAQVMKINKQSVYNYVSEAIHEMQAFVQERIFATKAHLQIPAYFGVQAQKHESF